MSCLQKSAAVHSSVYNHFNQERHFYSRGNFKLNSAAALTEWRAWMELESKRPVLFPARRDKASERFAKRLTSYLGKNEASPAAPQARAWLDRWEE